MKKIRFFEKKAGAKTVYIMAGVSFCLAAIAVAIVYSDTVNKIEKELTVTNTTRQVNLNRENEPDPRYSTTLALSSTEATTSEQTTTEPTESQGDKTTVAKQSETQASAVAGTTEQVENQSFILPSDGKIIREYSAEIPIYCETMEDWRTHSGVDFAVKEDEEVLSVGKGKVSKVLVDSVYGYTIEVDYGQFTARYCGMKQGECVGINQLLNKGDSIGKVEAVPCESKSERHLHFEIVKNGDYVDPLKALKSQ